MKATSRCFALGILLLTMFLAGKCWADGQDDEWNPINQHPIDKVADQCVRKAKTPHDDTVCQEERYRMWDQEMNKQYALLLSKLSANEKKNVEAAQAEWVKYRDQEFKVIQSVIGRNHGTMYMMWYPSARARIVRQRALILQHWVGILDEAASINQKYGF